METNEFLYILAGLICAAIAVSNHEDEQKFDFSMVVAVSLMISFIFTPVFNDKSIHLASIIYNLIICSLLIATRCKSYMYLCYIYAISILNEVGMYAGLVFANDVFFQAGQSISIGLIAIMIIGMAKGSNGFDGFIRYFRHRAWDHRRHHHNDRSERRA